MALDKKDYPGVIGMCISARFPPSVGVVERHHAAMKIAIDYQCEVRFFHDDIVHVVTYLDLFKACNQHQPGFGANGEVIKPEAKMPMYPAPSSGKARPKRDDP